MAGRPCGRRKINVELKRLGMFRAMGKFQDLGPITTIFLTFWTHQNTDLGIAI
jgi:hypothetical protein